MTAQHGDGSTLPELYRDLKALGNRASGTQYSATLLDGRPVVVHTFSPQLAAQIEQPERFFNVLKRAATIDHPSIARLLAWGGGRTASDVFHCAYASQDGGPLTPGSLSPARVAKVGLEISQALSSVHKTGLVHAGIHPGAIVHSKMLGAQLSALGLCAALIDGGVDIRDAALAVGDVSYLSPEQVAGGAPDARSDIYSLGASLYQLLTGKPPFGGRNTTFVMATVLSEGPSSAGETGETDDRTTSVVVEALLRAIERAPDDRWPTAEAFARALGAGAARRSSDADRRRGWSRIFAIFRNLWFPTRRSRE